MNSKNSIIIKVVLLSVLAVFLVGVMLFFMLSKWSFKRIKFSFGDVKSSKLVISETYNVNDINKIDFKLVDSDVDIRYSENDEVRLEVYDKNDNNVDVSLTDGILSVDFEKFSNICIGFCFNNRKTILYLPKEFNRDININSASGDVLINSFPNSSVSVSTASGDIKVEGALKGKINSTSGEVFLRDIPVIDIKTISGDIDIINVTSLEGSSVSGSVEVNGLTSYINFKTTSGDYELSNINLDMNSKLSSISGDVEINGISSVYVNTSTVSGDIEVNSSDRKSDIELSIKTTSGDIEVS